MILTVEISRFQPVFLDKLSARFDFVAQRPSNRANEACVAPRDSFYVKYHTVGFTRPDCFTSKRVFLDEFAAGLDVVAHQDAEELVGGRRRLPW